MPLYQSADHRMLTAVAWEPEKPAERANDHILVARGTSNAHVVTSDAGDVVINTGTPYQGRRNRERFEQMLGRPLDVQAIVLTQYHNDHVGGWGAFATPGVKTWVQREFPRLRAEWQMLTPYYQPRGARFLMGMMPSPEHMKAFFHELREPEDLAFVDRFATFDVGGRRFELHSIPSGETEDSIAVWLPEEKTLFTGNFMGALYGALPNFYTIRGDRARSVARFILDIQKLIDFEPALLITGHDAPIVGAARIREDLTRIRDAVRHIHDETVKGMNAGKDVHTLMREIALPDHLAPEPGRGPIGWYVRAVWEEYSGWFMGQSTTELYGVPARAIWSEIAELAGGADVLSERARAHVAAGRPEQALHLTDIALATDPAHRATREVQIAALEALIDRSGGTAYDEMGWLENELRLAREAIG